MEGICSSNNLLVYIDEVSYVSMRLDFNLTANGLGRAVFMKEQITRPISDHMVSYQAMCIQWQLRLTLTLLELKNRGQLLIFSAQGKKQSKRYHTASNGTYGVSVMLRPGCRFFAASTSGYVTSFPVLTKKEPLFGKIYYCRKGRNNKGFLHYLQSR